MSVEREKISAARQVERKQLRAGRVDGLIDEGIEARIAVRVHLRRKKVGVGDSEIEVFGQKGVLESGPGLDVVNSLHIRHVSSKSRIG